MQQAVKVTFLALNADKILPEILTLAQKKAADEMAPAASSELKNVKTPK